MSEPIFPKVKRCNGVKIWSRQEMDNDMMLFGWTAFNAYQRGLEDGEVSESGCIYSWSGIFAYPKKTNSGMCSVMVSREGK